MRADASGKVKGCPASRPGRDAQIAEAGRYKCRFDIRAGYRDPTLFISDDFGEFCCGRGVAAAL